MKKIITFSLAMAVCGIGYADVTHQWNFEDGTANDAVGIAHGVMSTNGAAIASGVLSLSGGNVDFNATDIGVHTYSAVTVEAWANNSSDNTAYHGMFMIWNQNGGVPNDYLFLQPARANEAASMGSYQIGVSGAPWSDETAVFGPEPTNTLTQYVLVIDDSTVAYYMDGVLIGSAANAEGPLSGLGTEGARLGTTGYLNDPAWVGDVEQLTIFNHAQTDAQVAARFAAGPVAIPEPATIGLLGFFGAGVLFIRRRLMI
jgi:hypothetical protein